MEECGSLAAGEFNLTQTARYDGVFEHTLALEASLAERASAAQAAFESAAEVWGVSVSDPATAQEVEQLFAMIVAEIPPEVLGRMGFDQQSVTCSLDLEAALPAGASCLEEAGCDAPTEPSPVTCLGRCDGGCTGSCVGLSAQVPSPNSCYGTCVGTCTLEVVGVCPGICQGTCSSSSGAEEDYEGFCPGECQGTCQSSAGAECPGSCEGECFGSNLDGNECRDSCDGSCEGDCRGVISHACDAWDGCGVNATAAGAVSARCNELDVTFAYPTRGQDPDLDARIDAFAAAAGELLRIHFEIQLITEPGFDGVFEEVPLIVLSQHLQLLIEAGADSATIVEPGRRHCVIEGSLEAHSILMAQAAALGPYSEMADAFAQALYDFRN